jgi:hypothetical protein
MTNTPLFTAVEQHGDSLMHPLCGTQLKTGLFPKLQMISAVSETGISNGPDSWESPKPMKPAERLKIDSADFRSQTEFHFLSQRPTLN